MAEGKGEGSKGGKEAKNKEDGTGCRRDGAARRVETGIWSLPADCRGRRRSPDRTEKGLLAPPLADFGVAQETQRFCVRSPSLHPSHPFSLPPRRAGGRGRKNSPTSPPPPPDPGARRSDSREGEDWRTGPFEFSSGKERKGMDGVCGEKNGNGSLRDQSALHRPAREGEKARRGRKGDRDSAQSPRAGAEGDANSSVRSAEERLSKRKACQRKNEGGDPTWRAERCGGRGREREATERAPLRKRGGSRG